MNSSGAVTYEKFESLWTVADVARYLRVSRSWVYQRTAAGLLPCLNVGGCRRFEPDAIRRYARGDDQRAAVIPMRSKQEQ